MSVGDDVQIEEGLWGLPPCRDDEGKAKYCEQLHPADTRAQTEKSAGAGGKAAEIDFLRVTRSESRGMLSPFLIAATYRSCFAGKRRFIGCDQLPPLTNEAITSTGK